MLAPDITHDIAPPVKQQFEAQFLQQLRLSGITAQHSLPPLRLSPNKPVTTLHWEPEQSDHPMLYKERNHIAVYAFSNASISEGKTLLVSGPSEEKTYLFIEHLCLSKGATLCLNMYTQLIIGQLSIIDANNSDQPALILLTADNGKAGPNGLPGQNGPTIQPVTQHHDTPLTMGEPGGNGCAGGDGTHGKNADDAIIWIASLEGVLTCRIQAGHGGNGGAGGQGGQGGRGQQLGPKHLGVGGHGGDGGPGGHGGNGGHGSTLYVTVKSAHDHSSIISSLPVAPGGQAGTAGTGGIPGLGHPDGQPGRSGSTGAAGLNGQPGTINITGL